MSGDTRAGVRGHQGRWPVAGGRWWPVAGGGRWKKKFKIEKKVERKKKQIDIEKAG